MTNKQLKNEEDLTYTQWLTRINHILHEEIGSKLSDLVENPDCALCYDFILNRTVVETAKRVINSQPLKINENE